MYNKRDKYKLTTKISYSTNDQSLTNLQKLKTENDLLKMELDNIKNICNNDIFYVNLETLINFYNDFMITANEFLNELILSNDKTKNEINTYEYIPFKLHNNNIPYYPKVNEFCDIIEKNINDVNTSLNELLNNKFVFNYCNNKKI